MNKEALIENYFSNRLTEKEFQELEQLLDTDAAFRQEFYSQLEIRQAIAHEKQRPLKERLQKLDQQPVKKKPWYMYAAAVTILIAIGFLFYDTQPNYQEVYATHFEPYPNVVSLTTRSDTTQEDVSAEAFELYQAQQYKEAAAMFQDVYKQYPEEYVHFYYGVSLLANGDTGEGIKVLEKYPWQQENGDFSTAVNWYVGLGYVKLEQPRQARFYLQKVADGENTLSGRAKEVLDKLD